MSDSAVAPLVADDFPEAAEMLARAFDDDPIWSALWPDPHRRATLLPRMFAAMARISMAAGAHATKIDGPDAAAVWIPPGRDPGFRALVRTHFAMPRVLLHMTPGEIRRMLTTLASLQGRRDALVPEPHWYLWVVGVEPALHGRGLGTLLVRDGLARADRDGTRAYLETETEANVRFYEGLGFTVLEQLVTPGVGVPMWLMARQPR